MSHGSRVIATCSLGLLAACAATQTQAVPDAGTASGTCQPCMIDSDCGSGDSCTPLPAGCGEGSVPA